jgi:hypothetical protein
MLLGLDESSFELYSCINLDFTGEKYFQPKEIRDVIREKLIPSISVINDASFSGLILTQDVNDKAKEEYNNGYPCLNKVSKGFYEFIGFLSTK